MYYDIIFKRKWDSEKSVVECISYDELKDTFIQLKNWIASFDWKVIYWINSLDELKIIEKNYEYKTNWDCFQLDENWDPAFCLSDIDDWEEHTVNITNKFFLEIGFIWDNKNNNKIQYSDWIMIIRWHEFDFEKKSKISEVIDLYFKAHYYFWSNEIKFEQLEEIFINQKYTELKNKDLNYESIRGLLKNRMKSISDELKVDNILDIKTNYIKISI